MTLCLLWPVVTSSTTPERSNCCLKYKDRYQEIFGGRSGGSTKVQRKTENGLFLRNFWILAVSKPNLKLNSFSHSTESQESSRAPELKDLIIKL